MEKYYHVADIRNLESIQYFGLVPRSWLNKLGEEVSRELRDSMHIPAGDNPLLNPDFVYLWKRQRTKEEMAGIKWVPVQLEVDLNGDHPIERDYDQMLIFLFAGEDYVKEFAGKEITLTEFYKGLFDGYGVDFKAEIPKIAEDTTIQDLEGTIQSIVEATDRIPEDIWDSELGAYRTYQRIRPEHITIIEKRGTS